MPFCGKCGSEVENGAKFCPNCGEKMGNETDKENVVVVGEDFADKAKKAAEKFSDTNDTTYEYDQSDILMHKGLAVISYIWFLCLIPLVSKTDSRFAQFHARQGFNLLAIRFCIYVISWLLDAIEIIASISVITFTFSVAKGIIEVLLSILMIIGIVNAARGKAKILPIIGGFDIWHLITKK